MSTSSEEPRLERPLSRAAAGAGGRAAAPARVLARLGRPRWRAGLGLLALAAVGLAALVLWQSGAGRPREPGLTGTAGPVRRAAAELPTVAVVRRTVAQTAEAVGTVRAVVSTTVSSKATGRVRELRVRAGERIERGQVLVVLSGEEARARVAQARAGLAAAEAASAEADRDYDRFRQLAAEQAATRRELEAAEARARVAQARVREARSALREAEALASDLVVRAPLTGVVADTQIDPGELAVPGRSLLTLYDPRRLRLEAFVREELGRRLAPGEPVEVSIDALGATLDGSIEVVVPQADPASRAFLAKVALAPHPALYPGMFGRLRFPIGSTEILAVPRRAVQLIGQLETVEVVEGGAVRTRQVRTGKAYGEVVEILAGLDAGERVVLPERAREAQQ